jgi:glycosyltransferase involved in cell wall biosynthesis
VCSAGDPRAGTVMAVPVRELSAVLPAHDEEGNIERTVREVTAALDGLGLDRFEVIVVDDGSADATPALADAMAEADPRVRAVHHPRNRGYGGAVRSGFDAARYDWVFLTDGDGQFDPAELAVLLPLADEADAVVGYRRDRADHAGRRVNAWLWAQVVRLVVGIHVRDVDCAFKLLRRSRLVEVGPLEADGAVISAELLLKLDRAGVVVRQVPVSHRPRQAGTPSGADPRVIARAFRELVRLRRAMHQPATALVPD